MKALTLYQPHASLVALGVKTLETRSWSTSYRGPLAIHAAAAMPPFPKRLVKGVTLVHERTDLGGEWFMSTYPDHAPIYKKRGFYGPHWLPLGAVVATCTLVDVVPMVESCFDDLAYRHPRPPRTTICPKCDYVFDTEGTRYDLLDQRPYGDFTPGRWAWLLADVKPLDQPVPAKGRQGLWSWEG